MHAAVSGLFEFFDDLLQLFAVHRSVAQQKRLTIPGPTDMISASRSPFRRSWGGLPCSYAYHCNFEVHVRVLRATSGSQRRETQSSKKKTSSVSLKMPRFVQSLAHQGHSSVASIPALQDIAAIRVNWQGVAKLMN